MIVLTLPDDTDDNALLKAARRGDRDAISQIYNAYLDSIYQFTRLRVGNPQTAEDITSNVFLKLIDGFRRGKGPRKNIRAWLFQVTRNEIIDYYGDDRELPMETIDTVFADGGNPEIEMLRSVNAEVVRQALMELAPSYQEVILLRFDQQLSLKETADIMGRNLNTVKTLQYRAINSLRDAIQRQELTL